MDDFYKGLCDVLNNGLAVAGKERAALRAEIKALKAELADRDPQLWEMAEQIQCLEMKLVSLFPTSSDTGGEHG